MSEYLLLSHIRGNQKRIFATNEIRAQNDEEARQKVILLMKSWKENKDILGEDPRDKWLLVKVISKSHLL